MNFTNPKHLAPFVYVTIGVAFLLCSELLLSTYSSNEFFKNIYPLKKTQNNSVPGQKESGDIPNFSSIDSVKEKKQQFFDFLRPMVEIENSNILHLINKIETLKHQKT